jgi:6-phosphogluconolactonase/glucosamine-6-phosphate isomerase/deaminase
LAYSICAAAISAALAVKRRGKRFKDYSGHDVLKVSAMGFSGLKRQILSTSGLTRRAFGMEPSTNSYRLVQEDVGFHIGIAADLATAARHAANHFASNYQRWLKHDRFTAWGHFKREYFTVAVGGGNTVKAQYQAMVDLDNGDIDWIGHVRFFFLEESTGEPGWESAEHSLVTNFIVPLAKKLIQDKGLEALARELGSTTDEDAIIDQMVCTLVNSINMTSVKQALATNNRSLALKRAHLEADSYAQYIRSRLGATMSFHYLISSIGSNGALGAFTPYTPELRIREPGVSVIKCGSHALRVALNRGVLTNAECVSLIVSGNLKLRALGRFEMHDSADFEQTVMETPLRMLRETRELAERVFLFADENSLRFEETAFKYTVQGKTLLNKAETRIGEEDNGVHILLLHGFMGLFSFTNFLLRLPSAWTVSALHRGSHAKKLGNDEIFPHYAQVLRQAILSIAHEGRPAPIAGHSIAGLIIDHLLLSLLDHYDSPITPYEQLKGNNRKLVDALRAGGIVHLAAWAPPDGLHTRENIKVLIAHYRQKTELDYSGFEQIYQRQQDHLVTTGPATVGPGHNLSSLDRFLGTRLAEPAVGGLNVLIRALLNNKTVQQRMLNLNSPYALRLVGNRLLKTASFYGLFKEINAAMHDPVEYQRRHLKALAIMLEYDIPFLSIVHEDDFLVSARRHKEEYDYLLSHRKKKEGVSRASELQATVRLITLKRKQRELPLDPLNPHLMILATSSDGNDAARLITEAMNQFINENIDRAITRRELRPLASVRKWVRSQGRKHKKPASSIA